MLSTVLLGLALVFAREPQADQTAQLQNQLNKGAGKTVTFPVGTFTVRTLKVPKNTRLTIGPKTIIKGAPMSTPVPVLELQSGVKLAGGGLIHGNRTKRTRGTGILVHACNGVSINGIRIQEVAEQGLQVSGSKNITLTNVQVNGCGLKGIDQYQGINIVITQNVKITGCRVENAQHGIQWWGDDTNGWCENIQISGNRVRRVGGGGIWGNRGRNVTVSTNTVEICGDVGVDFEHSQNCKAINNTVRDVKNYGLAVFFASEGITFTNNRVTQGLTSGHGIGLLGDGLSKKISFIGGSINTKGAAACGLTTIGTNVAQDVLVQGVRIVTEGSGGIPIRIIDNNEFRIINNPLISGANPAGVSLEGSSRSVVEGNVIVHRGVDKSQLGERGGIFVFWRSPEFPSQNNRIADNTIRGYRTGINDECWGNNNSNNVFENNTTPNLVHRGAGGAWGGKAVQNRTAARVAAPVEIKQ
ncbi:hypothetical protein DYU11_06265 [Fibrisoma montanum]|uniref:Right handed beta helix domain-containing protein n=1 Tax=Fibrisoma montanum TaxID=2305895 RepID=A0A418MDN1_9BACT|nr:right-handed parallel beta-helix repeat-containing protein [Fibrisoma montanum]RIV24920.1 hypothetical protein DYU11_06265 [Fibrisoma montanum]